MRRLSISNSETGSLRQTVLVMSLVLVILFVAEGVTRIAVLMDLLPSPEPLLWHRPEVAVKLHQIQNLETENGIDVLFVGNSIAYTGINPTIFDREFESITGDPVTSYNAGLASLPVSLTGSFVERVFVNHTSPRAIILVLSPRDLNENNYQNQVIVDEVMACAYGQALLDEGYGSHVSQFLLDHSMLFRYRNTIVLTALNGFRSPKDLPASYDNPQFDERGYVSLDLELPSRIVDGNVPGQSVAQQLLYNFDPAGGYTAGLERLMQFCRQRNIQLGIVNMPTTRYFMASFRNPSVDYQRYLDTVTTLTDSYGVPFWDFNDALQGDLFVEDDFSDAIHLNSCGAEKLSRLVAEQYVRYE